MRKNQLIFAIATLAIFVGMAMTAFTARVYAQRHSRLGPSAGKNLPTKQEAHAKGAAQRAFGGIRAADDPGPTFPVTVDFTLTLDANTQALYQQMATALSGYTTVPNDRINYYSAFNNWADYQISGWVGMVQNVQSIDGGNVVTVGVVPQFTNASSIVVNDYSEQYFVGNDGRITYQGFTDPNGWAGQSPPIIDL